MAIERVGPEITRRRPLILLLSWSRLNLIQIANFSPPRIQSSRKILTGQKRVASKTEKCLVSYST